VENLVRRYLKKQFRKLLWTKSGYCRPSYSQEGEDRIAAALLGLNEPREPGFYVDVGAHHPERYSNTFLFYSQGWNGINIDAMPGSMRGFQVERPRDINIEAAISDETSVLTFYEFNEPALNGFSKELAIARNEYRTWRLIRESEIKTKPLRDLLGEHLPKGRAIDFMSVDVEGLDLRVLKSNDWQKYRPAVVMVEDGEADDPGSSSIVGHMLKNGYRFHCRTPLTSFFLAEEQMEPTPMGMRQTSLGLGSAKSKSQDAEAKNGTASLASQVQTA
jgi:FkbM family methyltransferase